MSWWSSWLDRLLPRACALCGLALNAGAQVGVCSPCLLDLQGARRIRCPRCALALETSNDPSHCDCLPRFGGLIDRTLAAADYAPPIDRLITTVKFARQPGPARALGELVAAAWRGCADRPVVDLLIPVPLSVERLAERGFNQSLLMARACARLMPERVRVLPDTLLRTRHSAAQSGLGREARLRNLEGAFACKPLPAGARVALIDDVLTTGSTALAASRALREAGAQSVVLLVAARAGSSESISRADHLGVQPGPAARSSPPEPD
ncbi:MAG: ComF family protein [Burkholderiales bacterium]